jgi:ribulose bisphosphate carboxylase small subunit
LHYPTDKQADTTNNTMGYYIPPRFLNKLAIHITKNFLDLPNVKVPLILGIHGRKGEGKTFMCELVFKHMGIGVIYLSAGELESPDAGDPARLVRLRYREAGEWSRVNGRMAALMINDVDAGIGRVDDTTQYTVNTQLVNATLMNIADNPTNVQLPGSYNQEPTQRIPIIVTGNDFATMYAPLTRDGRMEKYYWEPQRPDRIGIVAGIFEVDQVSHGDVETLVDHFGDQSTDFFGAIRSQLYDQQVQQLIEDVGVDKISARVVNGLEALPEFRRPDFSLPHLIEVGEGLAREQRRLHELRLADTYNRAGMAQRREISAPTPIPTLTASIPEPLTQAASNTHLDPDIRQTLANLVSNGYRIGLEYTDPRHFRNNSWQCYRTLDGEIAEVSTALTTCLREHPQDYVRLVGIDPKTRSRLVEQIIHRP